MNLNTPIYLASPYSHPDAKVRQKRFEAVCKQAAKLMNEGYTVFCPIAHTHPLTEYSTVLNDKDHDFWLTQDFFWLDRCKLLYVFCLPGWKESYGVTQEILRAIAKDIPVVYFWGDENS